MKTVTVRYGGQSHKVTVNDSHTIAQIIADPTAKAICGYGDNVKPLVQGVEQSSDNIPSDGCVVTLETRMNSKAILTLAMAAAACLVLAIS